MKKSVAFALLFAVVFLPSMVLGQDRHHHRHHVSPAPTSAHAAQPAVTPPATSSGPAAPTAVAIATPALHTTVVEDQCGEALRPLLEALAGEADATGSVTQTFRESVASGLQVCRNEFQRIHALLVLVRRLQDRVGKLERDGTSRLAVEGPTTCEGAAVPVLDGNVTVNGGRIVLHRTCVTRLSDVDAQRIHESLEALASILEELHPNAGETAGAALRRYVEERIAAHDDDDRLSEIPGLLESVARLRGDVRRLEENAGDTTRIHFGVIGSATWMANIVAGGELQLQLEGERVSVTHEGVRLLPWSWFIRGHGGAGEAGGSTVGLGGASAGAVYGFGDTHVFNLEMGAGFTVIGTVGAVSPAQVRGFLGGAGYGLFGIQVRPDTHFLMFLDGLGGYGSFAAVNAQGTDGHMNAGYVLGLSAGLGVRF